MSRRLLALVRPGQERAAVAALPALVASVRHTPAVIRVVCLQPLPPPREDRHGRVVADTDHEMARISARLEATFAAATRVFTGVTLECVVRFGRPRREARLENEVFVPDIIASFEGRDAPAAIRYAVTGARRSAASASAASRATSSLAFWRRAMRTP